LDTDASDGAIGAVLSEVQDGYERVVAYASRRLDPREKKYCVTLKELLAVVYIPRYFRQYRLGREIKVRTDHSALTWLKHTPDPIGQQARWLEIMEEFDFTVEHRSGSRHVNADALSRRPCPVPDCACRQPLQAEYANDSAQHNGEADCENAKLEVCAARRLCQRESHVSGASIGGAADRQCNKLQNSEETEENVGESGDSLHDNGHRQDASSSLPWSWSGLKAKQQEDRDISVMLELMQSSQVKPPWEAVALSSRNGKTLWAQWSLLAVKEGLLKRRFESADGKTVWWQAVMPASLRTEFIQIAHGGMTGVHFGRRRTAAAIQSRAY